MPCMELFRLNGSKFKNNILDSKKNIYIEAGSRQSWDQWMNPDDIFIGLNTFGFAVKPPGPRPCRSPFLSPD